jgi:hypothetical protein
VSKQAVSRLPRRPLVQLFAGLLLGEQDERNEASQLIVLALLVLGAER